MRRLLVPTLVLLYLVVPAAIAHGDYRDLWIDCKDGKIDGTYSQADYRKAIQKLPADAIQYSDCEDILRSAQRSAARKQSADKESGGSGGGSSGGGSSGGGSSGGGSAQQPAASSSSRDPLASASAQERSAVTKATTGGGVPLKVGGEVIEPSSLGNGREVAASVSDLPGPLLAALGLIAIASLAGIAYVLVPRVRDRRNP